MAAPTTAARVKKALANPEPFSLSKISYAKLGKSMGAPLHGRALL